MANQKTPAGDWEQAISDSGLYKSVPTYGEATVVNGIELRYHNRKPLEYDPLNSVEYKLVIPSTTFGIGEELFGAQEYEVSESRAKEILEEHCNNGWDYIE